MEKSKPPQVPRSVLSWGLVMTKVQENGAGQRNWYQTSQERAYLLRNVCLPNVYTTSSEGYPFG